MRRRTDFLWVGLGGVALLLAACVTTSSAGTTSTAARRRSVGAGSVAASSSAGALSSMPASTGPQSASPEPPGSTSPAPASSASASGTVVHSVLTLFTISGQVAPGVTVTNHAVAQECLTDGVAGGDSYRCFTGRVSPGGPSFVFDPCFAAPGADSPRVLLCPTNPVRDTAIELEASTLPPPTAEPARVWAMELADQQACVLVNAAWGGLGPFSCSPPPSAASGGSGTTVADCHPPEGGTPWWQADCQAQEQGGSPFTAVRVLSVWG